MNALPLALPLVVLLACGGPAASAALPCHEQPLAFSGTVGQPIDAILTSSVFAIPLTVGSTRKTVVVDTGAPVTLLDPTAFAPERLPAGQGPLGVPAQLGGLSFPALPVVGARLAIQTADGPLAGLLGAQTLCHFETSFDYRQPRLFLGAGQLPTDLLAPVAVAAPVLGGGVGMLASGEAVTFPATRLLLSAQLDGAPRALVLDTGASFTLLSEAAFAALTADGRKVLDGLVASTVMGATNVKVTRVKVLRLGAADAAAVLVGQAPGALLQQLSAEVGQPVDGLLGGTFLREFLLTVDAKAGQLTLRRYPNRNHVRDEFTRLGFALRPITPPPTAGLPRYQVGLVFPGSDAAAKGLTVGTAVVAINGNPLSMLTPAQAEAQLLGAPGPAQVQTDSRSFTVAVEDLLSP